MHEHRQSSTGSRYRLSNLPSYSPFSPSPHPLFLFMTFFSPVLDDSFHYISVKKRTRATDRHWEGGNGGWELGGERERASLSSLGGLFSLSHPLNEVSEYLASGNEYSEERTKKKKKNRKLPNLKLCLPLMEKLWL